MLVYRRDFNARHEAKARGLRRGRDLCDGRHRVVIGDAHGLDAGPPSHVDQLGGLEESVGCGRMKVKIDHADVILSGVRATGPRCRLVRPAAFPLDEALVFADEQLEVLLFFGGELHEDLLAF